MSTKIRKNESFSIRPADGGLEKAIGHEARRFRKQLGLTIADVCELTGLSPGMMSKIENGNTSPSLSTLQALASALKVPVTALFRGIEGHYNATYVPAGQGLMVDFQGIRSGPRFQLLGHCAHDDVIVEPYLIEYDVAPDPPPIWRTIGLDFVYILDGAVRFRHGETLYDLYPGDALSFDSDATHGPEEFIELPFRCISIYTRAL